METHFSVLAWRISGTGEPGGLPSMGSHRVGHDRSNLAAAAASNVEGKEKNKVCPFLVLENPRLLSPLLEPRPLSPPWKSQASYQSI